MYSRFTFAQIMIHGVVLGWITMGVELLLRNEERNIFKTLLKTRMPRIAKPFVQETGSVESTLFKS